jgi:hypothetical protein
VPPSVDADVRVGLATVFVGAAAVLYLLWAGGTTRPSASVTRSKRAPRLALVVNHRDTFDRVVKILTDHSGHPLFPRLNRS